MVLQLPRSKKRAKRGKILMVLTRLGQTKGLRRGNLAYMDPWIIEKLEEERKKRERQEAERPRVEIPVEPPREPEKKPDSGAIYIQLC